MLQCIFLLPGNLPKIFMLLIYHRQSINHVAHRIALTNTFHIVDQHFKGMSVAAIHAVHCTRTHTPYEWHKTKSQGENVNQMSISIAHFFSYMLGNDAMPMVSHLPVDVNFWNNILAINDENMHLSVIQYSISHYSL